MDAPAVQLAEVRKSYGLFRKRPALNGVTLRIARGECYGLAGPNGAGKTTLIKVLLGLVAPDEGEARLFGEQPENPDVRRRVGFVPESAELPHGATPLDLVTRWARLRGLPVRASREEGERHLIRLGMKDHLRRIAHRFSKGEKQRTLLALALLGSPDLLVLDEPTDGLDPLGRALMRQVIAEECLAGRTVFLNSHLLSETERLCTRVGILHNGRLVREEVLGASDVRTRSTITLQEPLVPELVETFELRASGAGTNYLAEHEDVAALNATIDELRSAGALIVAIGRTGANLEGALAEVAAGESAAQPAESFAIEEGPPARISSLRPIRAIYRVAREIASDLWARRIFHVGAAGALLLLSLLVYVATTDIGLGLGAAGRVAATSQMAQEFRATAWVGGFFAQFSHWGLLIPGVFLAGLFAPPLIEPRRGILLHVQPVSRGDVASGIMASVLGMTFAIFVFFDFILFGVLQLLGTGVSARFLAVPAVTSLAFASIYAATVAATYLFPSGLFAAFLGVGQLVGFAIVEGLPGSQIGKAHGFAGFLAGVVPRPGDLGFAARDLGTGAMPHWFPLASTLVYTFAVALIMQVIARRSER